MMDLLRHTRRRGRLAIRRCRERVHLVAIAAALLAAASGAPAAAQVDLGFDPTQGYDFDFDFYPTQAAAGDLDADGRLDLVVVGRNVEGVFAVFPGVAGGPFGPPSFVHVGRQLNSVRLHDLDGDGHLDLVAGSRSRFGRVLVMTGAGDRTFIARRNLTARREISDVHVSDVDADGDPDIVALGYETGLLHVFTNDGDGGFDAVAPKPLGLGLASPVRPFWITGGDFDGDAREDLLVTYFGSGHLGILSGGAGPDGGPGPARRIPLGTPSRGVPSDVDGDGDLDIVTPIWDFPTGTVEVLVNDGAANFTRVAFPSFSFYLWALAMGDFDGDGRPEPFITEALNGGTFIYQNQTPPGQPIQFRGPVGAGGATFPWSALPVDVDDDCDIDIIVCDIAAHRVGWWINFTPQVGPCAAADADGNGRLDLADLLAVLAAWGAGGGPADLDRDGRVGPLDLLRVAAAMEDAR